MTRTRTAALLALPDLAFVADGGELVREIERYLATQPKPQPTRYAVPTVCPHGQAPVTWDLGMTRPQPTAMDRLRRRPPAPTPIDTATHLRLLSRYLTVHGWCQGLLWDESGRRCLLGAQLAVLAAGYGTQATAMDARRHLMEQFTAQDPTVRTVDQWNDHPGRTAAQVHRALDIAAARAARH
ncbi:hypothetical protein GCM10010495_66120 [Kitasatospora herbaricolor]|uniref:DUF6197 family protein n=1 Tax=Kitasatospora herbaricolor TaxID=68217 RepID=UPI0017491F57|nr:hypothetical protein [Kitasatospora herbaricolor]MDQ0307966.1 hypothetical protein [Kitasatospora herbaricolor]GGV39534.1 hypothetical protein GCM10010495_66120 [Kitasatospora herbaricolor]